MQKRAKGHKYESANKVPTNINLRCQGETQKGPLWIQRKAILPNTASMTMQPQEEGFGETRRKHLCQSGNMQPKEEGFGETRRKHLCRSKKWSADTMR